jgi:hypothetical protein
LKYQKDLLELSLYLLARQASCALFDTDDVAFRGLAGLSLVILDDVLSP